MIRRAFTCIALAIVATTSHAVVGQTHARTRAPRKIATVPFGVHEKATFKVSFSGIGVGSGSSEVAGIDTVRGVPVYHFVFKVKGGMILAHVDDTQESWADVSNLSSLTFHQNQQEV